MSLSRKWKVIFGITATALAVFYLEFISYVINTGSWASLPDHFIDGRKAEPIRVLIVADPQIQGERDEHPFLGYFTRWDADRYLKRTYSLAKFHVKPDAVLFLGDLFDEGSRATYDEYRRYFSRFSAIFDLPAVSEPGHVSHVFIPGDNDVGGESMEPVSREKRDWFNRSFGSYSDPLSVQKGDWNVQFVKYNKFFPEIRINALSGLEEILNQSEPTFRIILSHFSVLNLISESTQTAIAKLKPSLIFCAHEHVSSYYRLNYGPHNSLHTSLRRNFLSPLHTTTAPPESLSRQAYDSDGTFQYFHFNMNEAKKERSIHEIDVPTSSYRMGVKQMGYGELHIYEDGNAYYTVLWSPSRFRQLYFYLGLYILSKIIFTPYFTYKFIIFAWRRYKRYRRERSNSCNLIKSNGMKIP